MFYSKNVLIIKCTEVKQKYLNVYFILSFFPWLRATDITDHFIVKLKAIIDVFLYFFPFFSCSEENAAPLLHKRLRFRKCELVKSTWLLWAPVFGPCVFLQCPLAATPIPCRFALSWALLFGPDQRGLLTRLHFIDAWPLIGAILLHPRKQRAFLSCNNLHVV